MSAASSDLSDEEVLAMWRRGELVVRTERDQAVEYAAELHAWLVDEANGRPSLNYPDSPMNGWPNGWKW